MGLARDRHDPLVLRRGRRASTRAPRIDVAERPDEHGELHACTAEDGLSATLALDNGVDRQRSTAASRRSAPVPPRLTVLGADAVCEILADERVVGPPRRRHARGPHVPTGAAEARRAADRHDDPMRRFAEVVRDVVTSGEVPPGVPTFADGHACDVVLDQLRAAPVVYEGTLTLGEREIEDAHPARRR